MKDPLKTAVIYQIVLRNFTRDGNFRAATEMLGHVRSAGVDSGALKLEKSATVLSIR